MSNTESVVEAANRLYRQRDNVSLEVLIGMREIAIKRDQSLADDVDFEPKYETNMMGSLEDVKALGIRIMNRWNKELCNLVCGTKTADQSARKEILDSLNLGEAAVIAAVASALLSLGVAAAIAAALAPLLVRRFIWPAKDELCSAWAESLNSLN